jgi:hypothetical protein
VRTDQDDRVTAVFAVMLSDYGQSTKALAGYILEGGHRNLSIRFAVSSGGWVFERSAAALL